MGDSEFFFLVPIPKIALTNFIHPLPVLCKGNQKLLNLEGDVY